MRFKGLDLNLLVALDALLTERSVSKAGRQLFRSQSAMSIALGKLREHFQDELLVPVGRSLVLTARAERMIAPLRHLMSLIEETVDVGATFVPATTTRQFTICVTDLMVGLLMPEVERRVRREAPTALLEIVSAATGSSDMLETGQADLLIVTEGGVSRKYPAELLYEDEQVALGWAGNPYLTDPMTAEAFAEIGRVVPQFGRNRNPSSPELQLRAISGRQNVELITPSYMSSPKFLIETNRIIVMHRSLAESYTQELDLKISRLPITLRPVRFMIQNHPNQTGDVGTEWLKDIIRDAVDVIYNPDGSELRHSS